MNKLFRTGIGLSFISIVIIALFCLQSSADDIANIERKGRVLSPKGLPLSKAEVKSRDGKTVLTDEGGEFSLKGLTDILEATHPDYPECKALVIMVDAPKDYLVLVLRKTVTLKGEIQTEDKKPIGGADIYLEIRGAQTSNGFAKMQSLKSNDDGSYEIKGLGPGNEYRLAVYAKGYSREITATFHAKPNRMRPEIIVMKPGRTITIAVMSPDGKPATNKMVFVGGKDLPYGKGLTDDNGKIALDDMPNAKALDKAKWKGMVHVSVDCPKNWRQDEYWYEPDKNNEIVIRMR